MAAVQSEQYMLGNLKLARLFGAAALAACALIAAGMAAGQPPRITLMTWNIYYGGGGATTSLSSAMESVLETNFPQRATAIADAIDERRPHIVCLQEVAYWQATDISDIFEEPETLHEIDFLSILQSRLLTRGLHYDVIGELRTIDFQTVEVTDDRLIEYEWVERLIVLARRSSQLVVGPVRPKHFGETLSFGSPPFFLEFERGWIAADVTFRGRRVRYVCTHLEALSGSVRAAQAAELIDWLGSTNLPVVLMGDFNTLPGTNLFQQFTGPGGAGYTDAWAVNHPPLSGPTCCQDGDLQNNASHLAMRIDHIFTRGDVTPLSTARVGHRQADRTNSGLWPSDHAGVVAKVRLD